MIELKPKGTYVTLKELMKLGKYANFSTLKSNYTFARNETGEVQSHFFGSGMDFAELRHYVAGDEVRNIDWHTTARLREPYTKIYHEDYTLPYMIVLDLTPGMFFGTQQCLKSVCASYLASLFAWFAANNNNPVGALIYNQKESKFIPIGNSKKNLSIILKTIAKFSQAQTQVVNYSFEEAQKRFNLVIKEYINLISKGNITILISDFVNSHQEISNHLFFQLANSNKLYGFLIYDIIEELITAHETFKFTDGAGHWINFSNNKNEQNKNYTKLFSKRIHNLQKVFKSNNAVLQSICSSYALTSQINI